MANWNKLSPVRIRAIVAECQTGERTLIIARKFMIHPRTVTVYAARAGYRRPRNQRLRPDETILAQYASGASVRETARICRVSQDTVRRVLKRNGGGRPRNGGRQVKNYEAISTAYLAGEKIAVICALFDCSHSTIQRLRKQWGYPRRPQTRPRKQATQIEAMLG